MFSVGSNWYDTVDPTYVLSTLHCPMCMYCIPYGFERNVLEAASDILVLPPKSREWYSPDRRVGSWALVCQSRWITGKYATDMGKEYQPKSPCDGFQSSDD